MITGRASERSDPTLWATAAVLRDRELAVEIESANAFIRSKPVSGWYDSRDIRDAPGDIARWPAKIGSAATQASPALRPEFKAGRPRVEFDSVGEALATGQLLTGTLATVVAVCKSSDVGGNPTRVIWEQTQQYNGNSGAIFGYAGSGTPASGGYAGCAVSSGDYVVGDTELDDELVCMAAVYDRDRAGLNEDVWVNDDAAEVPTDSGNYSVGGNFAAGTGSWLGSRNNGGARPLGGELHEFVAIDGEFLSDADILRARRGLLHKAGEL